MIKNRIFLLALLIPLLLDLLVVFVDRPSGVDLQTCFEQEATAVLETFRECEEQCEEEEDVFFFHIHKDFQTVLLAPDFHGHCHYLFSVADASALASGWMMPLRI